ncbi:MAG: hypothetical protein ACFFCQ_14100, partial [Promethearchaeota archaeon]
KKEFSNTIQQISRDFDSSTNEVFTKVSLLDEDVTSSLSSFNHTFVEHLDAYIDTWSSQSASRQKKTDRDFNEFVDQITTSLLSRARVLSDNLKKQNVEFSRLIKQISTYLNEELEKWGVLEDQTKQLFNKHLVELAHDREKAFQKLQKLISERDYAIEEDLVNAYSEWESVVQGAYSNLSSKGKEKISALHNNSFNIFNETKETNTAVRQDIETVSRSIQTKLDKRFKTATKEFDTLSQQASKNLLKAFSGVSTSMIEGDERIRTRATSFIVEMENDLTKRTSEVQTGLRRSLKDQKTKIEENMKSIRSSIEDSLNAALKTIQTVFNDLKYSFNELTTQIGTDLVGTIDEFQVQVSKEMTGIENDSGNSINNFRYKFNSLMKEKEDEISKLQTTEENRIAETIQDFSATYLGSGTERKAEIELILNEITERALKHLENLDSSINSLESKNQQLIVTLENLTTETANDIHHLLPQMSAIREQFQKTLNESKDGFNQRIENLATARESVEKETITKALDSVFENLQTSSSQLNESVEEAVSTTQNKLTVLSTTLDEEHILQQKEIQEVGIRVLEEIRKRLGTESEGDKSALDTFKTEILTGVEKTVVNLRKKLLSEARTLHSLVNSLKDQISPDLANMESGVSEKIDSLIQTIEGTYSEAIIKENMEGLEKAKHLLIEIFTQLLVQSHKSMAEARSKLESSIKELQTNSTRTLQNFSKDTETVGNIFSSSSRNTVSQLKESIETSMPETMDAISKFGEEISSQMNEKTSEFTKDLKDWILSADTQMKTQSGDLKAILINMSKKIDKQIISAQTSLDKGNITTITTVKESMTNLNENLKNSISTTTTQIDSNLNSSIASTKGFINSASEDLIASSTNLKNHIEEFVEQDKKQTSELLMKYIENLNETSTALSSLTSEMSKIDFSEKAENRLLSVADAKRFALAPLFERAQSRVVLALPHPDAIPIEILMNTRPSVRVRVAVNLKDKDENDWINKLYDKKVNITVYNLPRKLPTLVVTRDKKELLISPYSEETSAAAIASEQPKLVHFIDDVVLPDLFRKAKRIPRKKISES